MTAACNVTVDHLNVTLKGALQDREGNPMLFSWNMETDNTWVPRFGIEQLSGCSGL